MASAVQYKDLNVRKRKVKKPYTLLMSPVLQAKELLDHLEGVLGNLPVEVVQGNNIVEVKPQGVSKGAVVDRYPFQSMNFPVPNPTTSHIGEPLLKRESGNHINHIPYRNGVCFASRRRLLS